MCVFFGDQGQITTLQNVKTPVGYVVFSTVEV